MKQTAYISEKFCISPRVGWVAHVVNDLMAGKRLVTRSVVYESQLHREREEAMADVLSWCETNGWRKVKQHKGRPAGPEAKAA